VFFIDPIPLAASALDAVLAGSGAAGIILTNGNHQRASLEFRERLDCPILAHASARSEVAADQWLAGDARVADFAIIELPGSGPGEIALLATHGPGILVLGDALINLAPEGLRPLPEKYCTDPAEARASLEKLRGRSFETLCLAHGPPVTRDARPRLEAALDRAQS
jgi:glyoxylase-like metal-dependent hydrolase (beta-lactamase superfamily II)